ncbi:PTS system IIB component, L-Asc family [Anaerovirgula multivorans]|uniref:PTS system IIB component, L-Asc family n=1 Tax=Anaerovirgula multivorans TaxID=312168 RepID=A0A239F755_9FIRM|nr:PTS sugar transporter subunit IIB [Anaerovirgula multivorans]SNS51914.1 PTS system IIB component, L-Asc family [Anaerovirgula multivorans]
MKKILIVCGNGLGSSFMVSLKVEGIIKKLGIDATVEHTDLSSAKGMSADLYLGSRDIIMNLASENRNVAGLINLLDEQELKKAITDYL